MKKCPRCKMTTNSHSECMVCKFDVTDVNYSKRESEKYVFNKYLYSYIFKNHMFLIACIALVISMLILALPAKDWYVYIACLLLLIDSFTSTLYPEGKLNKLSKIYSTSFLETHFGIHKYITGAGSILVAFLYLIVIKL